MLKHLFLLSSLTLLAVVAVVALQANDPTIHAQDTTACPVDEVLIETIDESVNFVSRVIIENNSQLDMFDAEQNVALYYRTLISMRRYHEGLTNVPACAQATHDYLIASIIAAQDLLGVTLMQGILPTNVYANEFDAANTYVGEQFAALNAERRSVALVPAGDA